MIKTEQEWQGSLSIVSLTDVLKEQATERRLILYGCACIRKLWRILKHEWNHELSRQVFLVSEKHAYRSAYAVTIADKEAVHTERVMTKQKAAIAATVAEINLRDRRERNGYGSLSVLQAEQESAAASAAFCLFGCSADRVASYVLEAFVAASASRLDSETAGNLLYTQGWRMLTSIFRDIFPSPFSPFPESPPWRTPTVIDLATAAYQQCDDDRSLDPARLLILSDALEEAGCTEEDGDILCHLREPAPYHYRECRVIDFLRRKDIPWQ